jgi:hypothetical protein
MRFHGPCPTCGEAHPPTCSGSVPYYNADVQGGRCLRCEGGAFHPDDWLWHKPWPTHPWGNLPRRSTDG